jgi:hypothetical protein
VSDLKPILLAAAQQYGVDPAIAQRVMHIESRGNPNAISPAGAIGAMQLMPATARELGVDPNDPVQNVQGGVRYLAQMINEFGPEYGPLAYNAGPGRMRKVLAGQATMPAETQNYQRLMKGDNMPVLPMTQAAYGGGGPTYLYEGQPEGNFKAQRAMDISPEAVADLQRVQEFKRRMLPLALGSMMSEDRGSQLFGANTFREAMEGVEPYKLQNGVLTDSGEYVTDQDPSSMLRAQAAMTAALNKGNTVDANGNIVALKGTTLNYGFDPETGDKIVTNNGAPYRVTMGPQGPVYTPFAGTTMDDTAFKKTTGEAAVDLKSANELGNYAKQVLTNPGAFSLPASMAAAAPEMFGIRSGLMNKMMTADERKTRAAIFNQAQNEITRLAGAAQSVQEAARIQRFMPADWDTAEDIANKLDSARQVSQNKYEANAPGIQKAAGAQVKSPQVTNAPTTQSANPDVQLKPIRDPETGRSYVVENGQIRFVD